MDDRVTPLDINEPYSPKPRERDLEGETVTVRCAGVAQYRLACYNKYAWNIGDKTPALKVVAYPMPRTDARTDRLGGAWSHTRPAMP